MPEDQYWVERMLLLEEALQEQGEEYLDSLRGEYDLAIMRIQEEIDAFYLRFAKNNQVSLSEARKLLTAGELKEFRWTVDDYIRRGRTLQYTQRFAKQLENASIRYRVSRLEALQLKMEQQVETVFGKHRLHLLGKAYEDRYYHTIYEVQKGTGIGSDFAQLDLPKINTALSSPWHADGTTFSDSVWKDQNRLIGELKTTLSQGFIRGDSPQKMISALKKRMDVSFHAAARLVMTEMAAFSMKAQLDSFRQLGVKRFRFVATLDLRTSTICQEMDGKVFELAEAVIGVNVPPLHPWCRSVIAPYIEGASKGRIARGADGKTYTVPGDMTYPQWYKRYVQDPTAAEYTALQQSGLMRLPALDKFSREKYNNSPAYVKLVERHEVLTGEREWRAVEFNPHTAADHFDRHGAEVGANSREEYTLAAIRFINEVEGKKQIQDSEGTRRFYLESTNEFASAYPDGTVRTYFKPKKGIKYWEGQVKQSESGTD